MNDLQIINKKLDMIYELIFGIYCKNSSVISKVMTDYGNLKFELEQKKNEKYAIFYHSTLSNTNEIFELKIENGKDLRDTIDMMNKHGEVIKVFTIK